MGVKTDSAGRQAPGSRDQRGALRMAGGTAHQPVAISIQEAKDSMVRGVNRLDG